MATLTVRKLDDGVYARLGERAKRNKRSLEAEAREAIEQHVATAAFDMDGWLAELDALRLDNPVRLAPGEDAVSLVRAIRDEE